MAKDNVFSGLSSKVQKIQPKHAILIIVLFIAGAFAIRQYIELDYNQSGASCYGYDCQPSVTIGGRQANTGYGGDPVSYGTLTVPYGAAIELTWSGVDVNKCEAIGRWTKFRGTYMPLTIYPKKISEPQQFGVKCTMGKTKVESYLNVIVADEIPNNELPKTPVK